MSTHVEKFLIIGTNPEPLMKKFEEKFLIKQKELDHSSYIGLHWEISEKGKRKMHDEKHVKEAIIQLEKRIGK